MAPKKKTINGFSLYMSEIQQMLSKQGKKMSMAEMPNYCKKDWESMSDQKKNEYRTRAKNIKTNGIWEKYTSIGEKVKDITKQSEDSKTHTNAMYLYIEELVRINLDSYYFLKQKFILIHINPYTCENEGFYFPAEISMAEFSLERGLIRTFHQLIGFDKDRSKAPPAPSADINNHARNNHLIDTFSKFPDNYTDILLKIIGFIIDKNVDEAVLNDTTLDLPPIYTAHCATGNELMIISSSLFQLYQSAVMNADKDDFNNLIRVFHLDKLFMELKNVSYNIRYPDTNEDEKALPSVAMASENLAKDMLNTIRSIGCSFHGKIEQAHVCSNYYVCKWIYIISTHCCQFFNIKLVPGCHFDFDLSKTESPVEEVFKKLNVATNDNFLNLDEKNNPQSFSSNNFPALQGESSTIQNMWGKTEQKLNPPSETILNKNENFPPLGNSKKSSSENTPNWHKNSGHSKDYKPKPTK